MQIRAVCHNYPKITLVSGIFFLSKIKKCLSKKTLERCRVNLENKDFSSDELNTSLKNQELEVEIKQRQLAILPPIYFGRLKFERIFLCKVFQDFLQGC